MEGVGRGLLGRWFFRSWMLRKKLAETRRPILTETLAWVVVLGGTLSAVEGVLIGWFISSLVPGRFSAFAYAPWCETPQWVAGVSLVIFGVGAFLAGFALRGRRPFGAYLAMLLQFEMLALGITLLYSGIKFDAPAFTTLGGIDIAAGLCLSVLLGLCWYTLDPLGLHWDPEAEQRAGRKV